MRRPVEATARDPHAQPAAPDPQYLGRCNAGLLTGLSWPLVLRHARSWSIPTLRVAGRVLVPFAAFREALEAAAVVQLAAAAPPRAPTEAEAESADLERVRAQLRAVGGAWG